jgi:predicted GH43/DUF377 family glycosyl hydrolase
MSYLESQIRRLSLQLGPNPRRVLLRPFLPSLIVKPLTAPEPHQRVTNLFSRVMLLEEADVEVKLDEVMAEFTDRHQRIREIFLSRFDQVRSFLPTDRELSESRRILLGSYFMNEYSLESSALFNPSMVASPDQSGLPEGHLRFILSLRATGEGHISSITFRSGVVSSTGDIRMDPVSRYVHQPRPQPAAEYNLALFRRKLQELGLDPTLIQAFSQDLPECFLMEDLVHLVKRVRAGRDREEIRRTAERALLLAQSNYTVRFTDGLDISEKIIFPFAQNESNGIEDARFVRFTEDDGSIIYLATYTAYDGSIVLPQMVETRDFQEFRMSTLNGAAVRNKGLALFPRRIQGRYVMLGRQDGENIHLMDSDHPHFWSSSRVILRPAEPWEFVQLGNCGSPIETPEGWLVLTHGVGAMRKYCIGAVLLDRDDPSRVLGRLREPLLHPSPDEREGYVPNVVYSCGSLIHAGHLILPYAVSDTASRFAVVPLADLLQALRAG